MRFDGRWKECNDGTVRPLLAAGILTERGEWRRFWMLVDTGADRSVLSADVWSALGNTAQEATVQLGGIGGIVDATRLHTTLRLQRNDGQFVTFRIELAVCLDERVLDMSVLGRDIIDMFALVADRESDVLTLLGGNHSYSIQPN